MPLYIFVLTEASSHPSGRNEQRLRPPAMPRRTSEGVRVVILNNGHYNGLALANGGLLPLSAAEEAQWTAFFRQKGLDFNDDSQLSTLKGGL